MDLNPIQIELNGIRYALRDSGVGQDSVLLLHGWPDDGTLWQYQVPALIQAGYRVVCPDLPGYGLTEAPTDVERYQLGHLVTDMATLIEELGLERVHCVAHDYGAVLGWELAVCSPKLKRAIQRCQWDISPSS